MLRDTVAITFRSDAGLDVGLGFRIAWEEPLSLTTPGGCK